MTKFSSLKRNGSITKYRDRRPKLKYTDFTRDAKLPTKQVVEARSQTNTYLLLKINEIIL